MFSRFRYDNASANPANREGKSKRHWTKAVDTGKKEHNRVRHMNRSNSANKSFFLVLLLGSFWIKSSVAYFNSLFTVFTKEVTLLLEVNVISEI